MWIVILIATFIAYGATLRAGFIWDDAAHLTKPELRSIGGLAQIWFKLGATQQYYPVLHSAFWVEYHLWGDAPLGYHLLNVLLHVMAAGLLATVLRRLHVPGAWIAALLFALHPVAVESVAWVAEQKNTLSTVFYLGAALAYLRFDRSRRRRDYGFATGLFLLALGAKTVTATLPAALGLAIWWRRDRLDWRRDIRPLVPWFVLAVGAGLLTSWVERTLIGAAGDDYALSFIQRCLLAGRAVWFYAAKFAWPADLNFMYPRWTIDAGAAAQYLFGVGVVGLILAIGWFRQRGALVALLIFVGSLFPALGFVNVYPFRYSFVADHFQYLADLSLCAIAGVGVARWLRRAPRWLGVFAVAAVSGGLAATTAAHARMYHDVFALYGQTLVRNPDSWLAHNNLGVALVHRGEPGAAIPHYEAALRLRPTWAEAETNLGAALNVMHQSGNAIPHLRRAVALDPKYAEAHNNLGIALTKTNQAAEAVDEFKTALQLKPGYAEAEFNLGLALVRLNQTPEAVEHFAAAAQLWPGYADAQLNWAIGLTVMNRFAEAVAHFQRAIELNPASPDVHTVFGRALADAGRYEEAAAQCRAAIALDPDFRPAHLDLAGYLRRLGRLDEASQELQRADRPRPR